MSTFTGNSKASEALSSIGIRLQQLDFQAPELDNNNMERQNIVEHSTLEEARPEVGTAANGTGTVLPGCSGTLHKGLFVNFFMAIFSHVWYLI